MNSCKSKESQKKHQQMQKDKILYVLKEFAQALDKREENVIHAIDKTLRKALDSLGYELPYVVVTCPKVEGKTGKTYAFLAFQFCTEEFGEVPETWQKDVEDVVGLAARNRKGIRYHWKDSAMVFTGK